MDEQQYEALKQAVDDIENEADFNRGFFATGLQIIVGLTEHKDHFHKFVGFKFVDKIGRSNVIVFDPHSELGSVMLEGRAQTLTFELLNDLPDSL